MRSDPGLQRVIEQTEDSAVGDATEVRRDDRRSTQDREDDQRTRFWIQRIECEGCCEYHGEPDYQRCHVRHDANQPSCVELGHSPDNTAVLAASSR
jgi:hypothetical protein